MSCLFVPRGLLRSPQSCKTSECLSQDTDNGDPLKKLHDQESKTIPGKLLKCLHSVFDREHFLFFIVLNAISTHFSISVFSWI